MKIKSVHLLKVNILEEVMAGLKLRAEQEVDCTAVLQTGMFSAW